MLKNDAFSNMRDKAVTFQLIKLDGLQANKSTTKLAINQQYA